MSKTKKVDPKVKDVLQLLAAGSLLATSLIMPHATALAIKEYEKQIYKREKKAWEQYNLWRLRQVIKRLEKQKVVTFKEGTVQITKKGKQQVLKYNLETMVLSQKTDGKWRLIIYDISDKKKKEREFFRSMLKKLRLLQLQESVYLTPFICEDEIEYLRQMFSIGREVKVITVTGIESEEQYKRYFGI